MILFLCVFINLVEFLEITGFIASFSKLIHYLIDCYSLLSHHNKKMIDQIRYLKNGLLVISVFGSYDRFAAFLADLFEDLIQTLVEQVGGIRALLRVGLSALDQVYDPSCFSAFLLIMVS